MKKLFLSVACFIASTICFSQIIAKTDENFLKKKEDSLKLYAVNIIQDINAEKRFKADSIFTRLFVRALKTNNSFNFAFDSLVTISKLYPPDSSFRIFTWQLVISDNTVMQHGAIQMKTADGTLKLFPLIDKSAIILHLADTVVDNKSWIGAVFYRIIQTNTGKKNIYTLLGFDEDNIRSNRKIIEVLHFENDLPVFGGNYFNFDKDSAKVPPISRYVMEYKKSAGARLTYDENLSMIVFEHLYSPSDEPKKKWTLIPDGDYEGFKWLNGQWQHVIKVFNQITPEGQEPVPSPVKDAQGNTEEDKLQNNVPQNAIPADTDSVKPKTTIKKKVKPRN